VCRRPQTDGTHYPEGIFLARGPGIRAGVSLPQLDILDVTPALLYSLGLEVPSDVQGRFPAGVFEPSVLKKKPCVIGAPTQPPDTYAAPGDARAANTEEQAEIYKRLRALGYIE
jgi:hypothetical protein